MFFDPAAVPVITLLNFEQFGSSHLGFDGRAFFIHIVEGDAALVFKYFNQVAVRGVDDSADGSKGFTEVVDIGDFAGLGPTMQPGAIQLVYFSRVIGVLISRRIGTFRRFIEAISGEFVEDVF